MQGDEPLLLLRQTGAPTAVGSNRTEAGRALLAAHPELKFDCGSRRISVQNALATRYGNSPYSAADTGRVPI